MRDAQRHLMIDQALARLRSPTAAPLMTPAECISAALSLFVPGPAWLISPDGKGVRIILRVLEKMGYKIVPMEREDYDG